MPFRYRLQKILDFRIRKKEEQLIVVQKAQNELNIAIANIKKNEEEIRQTRANQKIAEPIMYEAYDKYIHHLWEKADELEEIRVQKEEVLNQEVAKLVECEKAVKVLEKHKEKNREAYIAEEKALELKNYSEIGVQRFFQQKQEKTEEEELQELLAESELTNGN